MNKLELIRTLSEEARIPRFEAGRVVEIVFNEMPEALARGGRVEIRGLCSFFVKGYKSYMGRNPKTGEKVRIKPKRASRPARLASKSGKRHKLTYTRRHM